jgi:superfamily I DNA/RNA helicase
MGGASTSPAEGWIAGAGTGKTKTLNATVAHRVRSAAARADRVLAVVLVQID